MGKSKKNESKKGEKSIQANFLKKGKFELDLWLCDPHPNKKEVKNVILIKPRPLFSWIKTESQKKITKRAKLLDKVWKSTKTKAKYPRKCLSFNDDKNVYKMKCDNVECDTVDENDIFIEMCSRKPTRPQRMRA